MSRVYNIKRRGVSMVDVMFALTISALMLAGFAQLQNDTSNGINAENLADNMTNVSKIASSYLMTNYATLNEQIGVGSQAVEIPISGDPNFMDIGDLSTVASLPSNFQGNLPMGQRLHFLVRNVAQNGLSNQHLEGMLLTTGNQVIHDREIGMALNKMGTNGGGIMMHPPAGHDTKTIQGAFGGWQYPATQWESANGIAPTPGHIMMTLNSVQPTTSVYLSRYNMGNSDANKMHTNLDMDGNSIINTSVISGTNGGDIQLNTQTNGRVLMGNGGFACYGNAQGCHFDISDDGGFYDNNDSWITFQGWGGLKLENNLEVDGAHYARNGFYTSNENGIKWTGNNTAGSGSPQSAFDATTNAQMTYDNNWLNATGSSGFQGINTNIMQATRFQDSANPDFYVVPSNFSHMNTVSLTGKLATNGLDPNSGYPTSLAGGVHTWDLIAEGGLYAGSAGDRTHVALLSNGDGYLDGNLYVTGETQKDGSILNGTGNISAGGNIATNGLDVTQVANMGGGIYTHNVVAQNGIVLYNGSDVTGIMKASDGSIDVAGALSGSVIRPKESHSVGDSCGTINGTAINGFGSAPSINGGQTQAGDISKNSRGEILSCQNVNGNLVWSPVSSLFQNFVGCSGSMSFNNDRSVYGGGPIFVTSIMSDVDGTTGYINAKVGGQTVSSYANGMTDSGQKHWSTSAIVPPGMQYSVDTNGGGVSTCVWK